ncbi:hypothetical protein HHK36_003614 [Tetracentron sinense]|uniref:AAA+ ATPase domain-containing protein n=1 Tax=Tetracentron sinense TaxID=13715 RepID=A0A834ZSU1_TETSI|nr:hypothetical protein HHK36_003614 [Tetracentron sinense]
MEVANLVVGIMGCLCAQTGSEKLAGSNYLERPQVKLESLKKRMEMLIAREKSINKKLEEARVNEGKEPNAEVVLWLKDVQKTKLDLVGCIVEGIAGDKRCLNECFPNYYSRVKQGKRIEKKMKEVDEVLNRGNFTDDSLADFPLQMGKRLPETIWQSTTTSKVIEDIWKFLMNDDVRRIGIYGMGGVGKTTIMTHIHNRLRAEVTAPFDNIIFVTVSRVVSSEPREKLAKLQNDIAKKVKLDLSKDDDGISRAASLLEALERRKRIVLILDDMWDAFPIEEIGIPKPTKENGCKLVLTTRLRGVCRGMEAEEVEVKVFSEEDAWDLFRDKVGDDVLESSEIRSIAKEVAKECAGLPLAIVTVGLALRNENNVMDWKNAWLELRNSTLNIEGIQDKVIARLRFSYNRLRDNNTQSCFLYCALYPEHHEIDTTELIEYWMWEGLLGDEGTMRTLKRKGRIILNELKNACLLERVVQDGVVQEGGVRMHDLIRDMAISITRMSSRCIIEAGRELRNPPQESEWREDVEKVSLMRNDVKSLLGEPRCPKLSSLLLQYNSITENISHSFFNHMHNLKVLDLSYTGIKFLPDSLCNLRNLRALLLCSCWNLSVLPNSFAALTELQVLDLFYTQIMQLPEGMEMLVGLRRLNLSRTQLLMFPPGLLSKFTLIEDLIMDQCPYAWQLESSSEIIYGACIEELIGSRNLAILQIHFSNMDVFHSYAISGHSDQLESFKFWVGDLIESHVENNTVVICGYNLLERPIPIFLPVNILKLYIIDCNNIMHPPGTLANLKSLVVDSCQSLERLFLRGQLQHLKSLEEISVSNCRGMKEIISEGENEMGETSNNTIILSRLQRLDLFDLTNLISIYSGEMVCDSLCTIDICKCKELKRLPLCLGDGELRSSPPPALREIKGEKSWWDSLEWDHPDAKNMLQPFFKDIELQTGSLPSTSASTSMAT